MELVHMYCTTRLSCLKDDVCSFNWLIDWLMDLQSTEVKQKNIKQQVEFNHTEIEFCLILTNYVASESCVSVTP
jgi:hypothetical protein